MFIEKAKNGQNQWYLYLITTIIVFLATQVGGIPLLIYALIASPSGTMTGDVSAIMATNLGLALSLLAFLCGLIALLLCVKYIHKKKPLDIISGRNKFDWKRFLVGFAVWGILSILNVVIMIYTKDPAEMVFQFNPVNFAFLLLIVILLMPFQTSFEEILFRGYYMQGTALLFNSKWAALILTSLLFGLMHLANPEIESFGLWVALPQYIFMGFFLGYVALKDNGLELSIGIHAANNIISSLTYTSDSTALQTHALFMDMNPTVSHIDTLILIVFAVIFIGITNYKYRFIQGNIFRL